ncbi:MAG TPA: DUF481 domain-containing protein [Gammaproteobacteria bacterium]|nr:DUF481 domain-containing protein [Gammaproteobacteria bacterium]
MGKKNAGLACTAAAMLGVALGAQAGVWKGEAELGVVNTSGNTDTQKINARAKLETEREKWRHIIKAEALKSSDNDKTTAERYELSGQSNYKFNEYDYLFGTLKYEDDQFSGYDYRLTAALGYGRRLIHRDNLVVDVEAGPGYRLSKEEATGDDISEAVLRAAGDLLWKISKTTQLTEELSTEIGEQSTVSKSVTGLKSQINGNFATKITFTVKHVSDVPAGVKNTDTETAVTLVYSF